MSTPTPVHTLVSPWGRFGLYSYFIDAPQPAIIDTGVTLSPETGMAPALEEIGRKIHDVRWILLTHGHIDHMGGAYALWEMTGRTAQVVIHEADADLLRTRKAHVDKYVDFREQYLHDPQGVSSQNAMAKEAISGEFEPTLLVRGGEILELGDGVRVKVHHTPGHTPGSVAYEILDQKDVFVGDTVQIMGAANGFPGFEDPQAYRESLLKLRDEIAPGRLFLGHRYRNSDGVPYEVELDAAQAQQVLNESLEIESRIAQAFDDQQLTTADSKDSPYAPFATVAEAMGYQGDPTLEPSPFFTSMEAYRRLAHAAKS